MERHIEKIFLYALRKSNSLSPKLQPFRRALNQSPDGIETKHLISLWWMPEQKTLRHTKLDNSQQKFLKGNLEKLNKQVNDNAENNTKLSESKKKSETKSLKHKWVPNFRLAIGNVPQGRQVFFQVATSWESD